MLFAIDGSTQLNDAFPGFANLAANDIVESYAPVSAIGSSVSTSVYPTYIVKSSDSLAYVVSDAVRAPSTQTSVTLNNNVSLKMGVMGAVLKSNGNISF